MPLAVSHCAAAIIVGILPLMVLHQLPAAAVLVTLSAGAVLVWWSGRQEARWLALALLAFVWGCISARQMLITTARLSDGGQTLVADIVSLRHPGHSSTSTVVTIRQVAGERLFPPLRARLTWHHLPQDWCAGQRWRLRVHLQPHHGRLNQGSFDSPRWALANHQPLSGRILKARQLSSACSWRQQVVNLALPRLADKRWPTILMALGFGETRGMPDATRRLLQQTGTAHLMAISGLHIGLAAGFGWLAGRVLQFFLPQRWIVAGLPLALGWFTAAGYVWLSGANFPAVRGLLALSLWLVLRLRGIHCHAWQVWLCCVALILVTDPLSVLSNSLWLSSTAVAALIFWFQWAPLPQRMMHGTPWAWLRWLHLQCGITLLLLPMQWAMFNGANLLALPANLWAVPLVSFITTPLVLAALLPVMPDAASHGLWWLADRSLDWVFAPLPPLAQSWFSLSDRGLLLAISGWLGVIIWRFAWWRRYPLTVLVLILILNGQRQEARPPRWRLTMLDVGHGLAMVIERHGKAIIYDTGDAWKGGDNGQAVIIPYLIARGLQPEAVFVSHSHRDHIGGLPALKQHYPGIPVRSSYRQKGHVPCQRGQHWQWQGLQFRVLWPKTLVNKAGNNHSCVLRIDDGPVRVLLTGDIEAPAERALLKAEGKGLQAAILQVPHHGSKTSSTGAFLRRIAPEAALASAARFSQWQLPAPAVVSRYRQQRIHWHDTAVSGQISVLFYNDQWQVCGYRQQISGRWYHQWFGVTAVKR